MYKKFVEHLARLIETGQITLLAVSGGIDSVVLADLFYQSAYPFAIAHANFGLRSEESNEDETFVKSLAKRYNVPFFSKKLDAVGYAQKKHVSIQMAARTLRYNWFTTLLKANNMHCVATAHHQMDALETLVRHIIKGTGIAGLGGIKSKHGNVIRPLLFAKKKDIQAYAIAQNIDWRQDSSNKKSDYDRNYIRHHIVPHLAKLNPNLLNTFRRTQSRLSQVGDIFEVFAETMKATYWKNEGTNICILVEQLLKKSYAVVLLHHWLTPFGFTYDPVEKWVAEPPHVGKKIFSSTYMLIAERGKWLLMPNAKQKTREIYWVKAYTTDVQLPTLKISIAKELKTSWLSLRQPAQVALLDYDLLTFPLTLRPWKLGDVFFPFGMKGHQQKISDYLTNNKCPTSQKKDVYVLVSANKIAWVVGYRIDDRFKVTSQTKNIYKLCCSQ